MIFKIVAAKYILGFVLIVGMVTLFTSIPSWGRHIEFLEWWPGSTTNVNINLIKQHIWQKQTVLRSSNWDGGQLLREESEEGREVGERGGRGRRREGRREKRGGTGRRDGRWKKGGRGWTSPCPSLLTLSLNRYSNATWIGNGLLTFMFFVSDLQNKRFMHGIYCV